VAASTAIGRTFPHGWPAVAGWSFIGVAACFLFAISRWEVTSRTRATDELDKLHQTARTDKARWKTLVETAPVGIVEVGDEGTIEWWNGAAAAIFGWQGHSPGVMATLDGDATQMFRDLCGEALAARSVVNREVSSALIRNEPRDFSVSVAPLFSSSGGRDGLLMIVSDVTDRKRLEGELHQAQRMEAVAQLAGAVAHDFNNLLTLINGYTALLKDQTAERRSTELLTGIETASERASVLTGQLLAISRKQETHPKVVSPGAALAELSEVIERIMGPDIEVQFSASSDSGNVNIDPAELDQLVLNLANNARDAMPTGGCLNIAIDGLILDSQASSELQVPQGCYVRIAITDTGVGMDVDTRDHCFDPFFTTKGPRGTGLGLPAVKSVVANAGGAIRVDTAVGEGTRFDLYLPSVQGPIQQGSFPPPRGGITQDRTVLVAEDEALLRNLMVRVLEAADYRVLEAPTGEEALKVLERLENNLDILISDVAMPGISGPELATRLLTTYPHLLVLFISGSTKYVTLPDVDTTAVSFLAKPFTIDEFTREIRSLLDRASVGSASDNSAG
jgi:two-component system, cell cycle sensor histidine kinase and response regulator CckA